MLIFRGAPSEKLSEKLSENGQGIEAFDLF
jgi:hypothetical protein